MSDTEWDTDKIRLSIHRRLRDLVDMFDNLKVEAVNRAGDPEMPGGAAMVLLGPGADVEAFGYMQLSAIMGRIDPHAVEEALASDLEPPLSFLASWADIVREARGQDPLILRATIKREAKYLADALDWMLATNDDGEPWFLPIDDFDEGLHKVHRAVENVLHAGVRAERINAECRHCDQSPRLCLRRGAAQDGSQDHWYCPNKKCAHLYDVEGVRRCWRAMLVNRGDAPEWVPLRRAAMAIARPRTTIRTWTLPPVDGMGNPKLDRKGHPSKPRVESQARADGLTWVRWADVRAADDTTRRRGRNRQFVA